MLEILWLLDWFFAIDVELNIDVERVMLVDLMYVFSLAHGCYIKHYKVSQITPK